MEFISEAQAKKSTKLSYLGAVNSSAKLSKNKKISGQYTYIIYLAPASQSGFNVCKFSSPECRKGCLNTSGRAGIEIHSGLDKISSARIKKTKLFFEHQEFYMRWVIAEMTRLQKKAIKDNMGFSARLNGTSDIDYSKVFVDGKTIFEHFPNVQFYDYTKEAAKMINDIPNYHLTFSYTGRNKNKSLDLLSKGNNVAIVFDVKAKRDLPQTYLGYEVVDGDLTDYRVNDGNGVIVGLRFKKIADKAAAAEVLKSPFIVQV